MVSYLLIATRLMQATKAKVCVCPRNWVINMATIFIVLLMIQGLLVLSFDQTAEEHRVYILLEPQFCSDLSLSFASTQTVIVERN